MSEPVVRVFPDAAAVASAVAGDLAATLTDAAASCGIATVVLSGGSTPLALFGLLAGTPYCDTIPWASTHVFWADERLVPPDDPGSNYGQAWQALLRHVPLPPANTYRMRGEWVGDAAANDYSAQLAAFARLHEPDAARAWPRFDAVLLGLGADAHTASLFPGSPADSEKPVLAVEADYAGRPAQRLTLTPPVFNSARQVWFLVTGAAKSSAVAGSLARDSSPVRYPARRISPVNGEVVWYLDVPAASEL